MGSIGDVSRNPSVSDTISDMTGLRCPIEECTIVEISDVRGFALGRFQERSDVILLPLKVVTSGIITAIVAAPRIVVPCIPDSEIHTGERLCFSVGVDGYKSNLFVSRESTIICTAIALETKNDSASEILACFNGYGFETPRESGPGGSDLATTMYIT